MTCAKKLAGALAVAIISTMAITAAPSLAQPGFWVRTYDDDDIDRAYCRRHDHFWRGWRANPYWNWNYYVPGYYDRRFNRPGLNLFLDL